MSDTRFASSVQVRQTLTPIRSKVREINCRCVHTDILLYRCGMRSGGECAKLGKPDKIGAQPPEAGGALAKPHLLCDPDRSRRVVRHDGVHPHRKQAPHFSFFVDRPYLDDGAMVMKSPDEFGRDDFDPPLSDGNLENQRTSPFCGTGQQAGLLEKQIAHYFGVVRLVRISEPWL